MKFKEPLSTYQFELEFLKGEWYSHRYNGVRNLIDLDDPAFNVATDPLRKLMIKHLLWMERHIVLSSLPYYQNIEWSTVIITEKDFQDINIISEKTWSDAFPFRKTVRDVALAIMS